MELDFKTTDPFIALIFAAWALNTNINENFQPTTDYEVAKK